VGRKNQMSALLDEAHKEPTKVPKATTVVLIPTATTAHLEPQEVEVQET